MITPLGPTSSTIALVDGALICATYTLEVIFVSKSPEQTSFRDRAYRAQRMVIAILDVAFPCIMSILMGHDYRSHCDIQWLPTRA